MKKEKENKNDKIKEIILKVVHIVSYILSVGFIIVCVLVGVGSCNKQVPNKQARIEPQIQERVNIDNERYKYFLTSKTNLPGNFTDWEDYIMTLTDGCKIFTYASSYPIIIKIGNNNLIYNNTIMENQFNQLRFEYWYNGTTNEMGLQNLRLYNTENGNQFVIFGPGSQWVYNKSSLYIDSLVYEEEGGDVLEFNSYNFVSLYFDIYNNENLQFYFDVDNINPIQYLTYETTGMNLAHNTGSFTAKIDLTNFIFTSNGLTFKGLRFQYDFVLGAYFNGSMESYDNMTYLALSYIAYQEYYTGEWYKVAYPRIYRIETRTLNNTSQLAKYPFTDFSTYLWTNEGFKNIEIVNGSNQVWSTLPADPLAYLTYYQILNYEGTLNNVYIEGNNGTNVFVILANGFKSVSSLFAIGLLPGITIGTLLFLPLVVVIIFAIVKIIHK